MKELDLMNAKLKEQDHWSEPLKYVLDILQSEEAFTVEEYKHTHTHSKQLITLSQKNKITGYVPSNHIKTYWNFQLLTSFTSILVSGNTN